jgi:uncharacterized protein with HEPN domain
MPSDEATRRSLFDIQHHIKLAQGFTDGMPWETFKDHELTLYAVTRVRLSLPALSEAVVRELSLLL